MTPRQFRRHRCCAAVGALVAIVSGCGSADGTPTVETHGVKGKVLLAPGKPLTTGRVYFMPQDARAMQAIGDIGPDGSFELATQKEGDGVAAGQYKIRIDPTPVSPTGKGKTPIPKIPAKYTDEDTSGLLVTVSPQTSSLDPFVLK